jgi:hypothetical protein
MGHPDNAVNVERHVRESLTALDPSEAYVGAKIQVVGQPALRDGDLEWPAAGDGRNAVGGSRMTILSDSCREGMAAQ